MKRMFVVTLAIFISACASQPSKTVATDQNPRNSHDYANSKNALYAGTSKRVYLDDFELLHVSRPVPKRQAIMLGGGKD